MDLTGDLLARLVLAGKAGLADVRGAVRPGTSVEVTLDGASTVRLPLTDPPGLDGTRPLLASGVLQVRSRDPLQRGTLLELDDTTFELVRWEKSGDDAALTFEDVHVGFLRLRQSDTLVAADTLTRSEFARRLIVAAGLTADVEDDAGDRVQVGQAAAAPADAEDAWDALGRIAGELTETTSRTWHRFRTGPSTVVLGSTSWLRARKAPLVLRERLGGVHRIDWTVDDGLDADEAKVTATVGAYAPDPGDPADVAGQGPAADGEWLVASTARTAGRDEVEIGLTRERAG